ncbi:MAG TPA: C39 family peptidase [Rhizomicrobium sp.]|nr:C39 family peptidase [Rhizomicrobium sp.]
MVRLGIWEAVLLAGLCIPASAGTVILQDGNVQAQVTSWRELRFSRVVPQQFDFSCGSAAVATLLSFSYERPTSERAPFLEMYTQGRQDVIRKVGFSLLDMRNYLAEKGYEAQGFRADLDTVARIGLPAIVLITTGTYHHFVVLRGIRGDRVLIADPSRGLRGVPRNAFEAMWTGVLLLVRNHVDAGKKRFNDPADWALVPQAPLGRGLDDQRRFLSDIFLDLPLANEF